MAPEVCSRERYGPAVDIWSSGVVLYILLTGEPPRRRDTFRGFSFFSPPFFRPLIRLAAVGVAAVGVASVGYNRMPMSEVHNEAGSPPWENPPHFGIAPDLDFDGELAAVSADAVNLLVQMQPSPSRGKIVTKTHRENRAERAPPR